MIDTLEQFDARAAEEFRMFLAHYAAQKANATVTVKFHHLQGVITSVDVQDRKFRKQ